MYVALYYTYNQKYAHTFSLRKELENFLRQDRDRQILLFIFEILYEHEKITEEEVFRLKLLVETEAKED